MPAPNTGRTTMRKSEEAMFVILEPSISSPIPQYMIPKRKVKMIFSEIREIQKLGSEKFLVVRYYTPT